MNLADIGTLIKNPHSCSSEQVETLKSLTEKYPYAQTFSILYLKALSKSNSIQFDEELKQHAFKITDRVKLFELIEEQEQQNIPTSAAAQTISEERLIEEPISELQEPETAEIPVLALEPQEAAVEVEELPEESETQTLIQTEEDSIESSIQKDVEGEIEAIDTTIHLNFEPSIDEIAEQEVIDSKEETHTEETKEIELPINETKEPQAEELDEEEALPITPISETELEVEVISHAISNNLKIEKLGEGQTETETETEREGEGEASVREEGIQNGKKTFSSWLQASKKKDFNNLEEKSHASLEPKENLKKEKIDQLVDQFIKEEPSIQRPVKSELKEEKIKKDFFSPTKNAKRSLDENTLPVSETLAKIFELQGNFPKAIYAYEQLILIIPEKKVFFANRIKELRKKLN
jgi:hypothetical protein